RTFSLACGWRRTKLSLISSWRSVARVPIHHYNLRTLSPSSPLLPPARSPSACKLQAWMPTAGWGGVLLLYLPDDGAAGLVGRLVGLDERLRSAPTVVAASSIRYC